MGYRHGRGGYADCVNQPIRCGHQGSWIVYVGNELKHSYTHLPRFLVGGAVTSLLWRTMNLTNPFSLAAFVSILSQQPRHSTTVVFNLCCPFHVHFLISSVCNNVTLLKEIALMSVEPFLAQTSRMRLPHSVWHQYLVGSLGTCALSLLT